MQVLIVSQYFWPEDFRINDLALGLLERGHEVTVLTGLPNYPGGRFYTGYGFLGLRREIHQGIEVVRAPLLPRGSSKGWQLALNYLSFALAASVLGPFVCRGSFDLIFVYEPSPITVGVPALVLKRFKHAPIMFWVQDLWPESLRATGAVRSTKLLSLVGLLVRFIYASCSLILIQAEGFAPHVQRAGAAANRIRYFPNWAEEIFQPVCPDAMAPELKRLPDGFRVVFAGNIGAAQDFPTILDAAEMLKEHKDIHWIILGDGRMQGWVENEIGKRRLGTVVHMLGRHPVDVMPAYFALADALLVTLKSDPIFSITVPTKIQSYLACGKPVIAALGGEGAQVIRGSGAGVACPSEDPASLAEAVLGLYRMSVEERRAMGMKGRHYFESHFERNMLLNRLDGWMVELSQSKEIPAK